ncbi:MAG: hypothetical protein FJZ01_21405 [Candidatus Sericytochromatia bacterium]|nr:hypothetical protein [Candidatus Tanganyikabacteria bacterium]
MPLPPALFVALATGSVPPPDPTEQLVAHRRAQLQAHQALGLTALGGLALAGVAGGLLNAQRDAGAPLSATSGLEIAHRGLSLATGAVYVGAAGLAIFAPADPTPSAFAGLDSVQVHKGLALVHGAALVSTVALGLLAANSDPALRGYHRAAGFATFGLLAASAGILALDF